MKWYHLLAVAVIFVVTGPCGITEAYSPFGGAAYNRALLGNVWVRADSNRDDESDRMTGAQRSSGFHTALTYGADADADDEHIERRAAYHSGLPFGKRTSMERRAYHSAMPFGKRGDGMAMEDDEENPMARRGYNSALMFGKRMHSALPFGKRGYHSGLPFGKRMAGDSVDDDEGALVERRSFHSGLPFGKRGDAPSDDEIDSAVNDILSKLRSEEN